MPQQQLGQPEQDRAPKFSFDDGLQVLPETLCSIVAGDPAAADARSRSPSESPVSEVRFKSTVTALKRTADNWIVTSERNGEIRDSRHRAVLFAGTAYKAAGWLELGLTTGRTRQDRERTLQSPRKSVWVRPLHPAFRQRLTTP